jgi:hypothetical protein
LGPFRTTTIGFTRFPLQLRTSCLKAPRSGLEGRSSPQRTSRNLEYPSRAPRARRHLRMRPEVYDIASSNMTRAAAHAAYQ